MSIVGTPSTSLALGTPSTSLALGTPSSSLALGTPSSSLALGTPSSSLATKGRNATSQAGAWRSQLSNTYTTVNGT